MTDGNGLLTPKTCATCEFSFDPKKQRHGDLECRRYPPTPLVSEIKIDRLTGKQTPMASYVIAKVSRDFWCGEHEPRVSAVMMLDLPREERLKLVPSEEPEQPKE